MMLIMLVCNAHVESLDRRAMKLAFVLSSLLITVSLFAQDAAQPTVDLGPKESASPEPSPGVPAEVPELSQLDEAFKQSSLGKAADEYRTRVEWRKLQNESAHDPAVVAAKRAAESAPTDLEKRQLLRDYYDLYYGKMRARAATPELRTALEEFRNDHLRLLAQPRVRPNESADLPTPTATPRGEKGKKKHKSKFAPTG
jgi:hypothetical protein